MEMKIKDLMWIVRSESCVDIAVYDSDIKLTAEYYGLFPPPAQWMEHRVISIEPMFNGVHDEPYLLIICRDKESI